MKAYALEYLFDLFDETDMIHWSSQVNVTKVTWTVIHRFTTRLALEMAIRRPQSRIGKATDQVFAIFITNVAELYLQHRHGPL
jgi:hypothetical protein